MVLDVVKDIQSLIIVAVIDIIGSGLHADRPFIIGPAGIAGAVLAVTGVIEGAAKGLVEELGKIIISISTVLAAISTAVTGIAAAAAIAAGGSVGVLPFVDDLLVSGLHLFEHFLRLLFIGVVNIGVRMILAAELPVCFFDLLFGGVPGNAQDFIRIRHRTDFLSLTDGRPGSYYNGSRHPNTGCFSED